MNKILLVIQREFLTRVRKKSFIIMTILGPLLFAAFMVVPIWLATLEDKEQKLIAVIDSSRLFVGQIPETEYLKFEYTTNQDVHDLKEGFENSGYYGILYISHTVAYVPNAVVFFSDKQPSLETLMHISNALEKQIEDLKLATYDIEDLDSILKSIETDITIRTIKWTASGEERESHAGLAMAVGYAGGFLIYFFIFFFGAQVMRGVIEEKTSRIVEVIVSSVRPFQLMMGKIVGIALVGLLQFLMWVILTFVLLIGAQSLLMPESLKSATERVSTTDLMNTNAIPIEEIAAEAGTNPELLAAFDALKDIDFGVMLGSFVFFFLGGYLLYASLFAAVGAAVDNETDTQQFMLPITLPLILAIFVLINAINNPESSVSFWFSIIPFTSPVVMMARIPFSVPWSELLLSMVLLILFFLGTTWLAAKIYRTGILMYGKKVSYKELWKWIRYKS